MSRFTELQRRLAALAEVASDGAITQRSLASKLEVSLGLANALLRGLESEGLVKAGAASEGYALTRAGRGAMQRMSREFAGEAASLLRKSLGSKGKAARLLPARRSLGGGGSAEAKRGR